MAARASALRRAASVSASTAATRPGSDSASCADAVTASWEASARSWVSFPSAVPGTVSATGAGAFTGSGGRRCQGSGRKASRVRCPPSPERAGVTPGSKALRLCRFLVFAWQAPVDLG
ncbi:MAG TPA: hypothetical protein VF223_15025, partial [Trebonia sp.]